MKKLKLESLQVKSFITEASRSETDTLKGGSSVVGNCTTVIFFTYGVEYCLNHPTHTCPATANDLTYAVDITHVETGC